MYKDLMDSIGFVKNYDAEIGDAMAAELKRQQQNLELIASENIVSPAVMAAMGSVLTNKYAEGYPGKRYYGGCYAVDVVEDIARERACKLFGADHANVQPHSGSQANQIVYFAMLEPGDTIMGMNLSEGGHLTHGSPVNISGKYFNVVSYGVDPETHRIDYDKVLEIAKECKPKMIVCGASAYPRAIDFKRFREIADEVGAYLMVDMAHIAGIVAAGLCENPVEYADIVTSTTHKTLRGPRGGLILSRDESLAKAINSSIFPYSQGGPLEHVIAAKAVCFGEDLAPEFQDYMAKVLENTKACNDELARRGAFVSGTENHLFLLNVLASFNINGKEAQETLESIGITCNKNMIHGDTLKPAYTSGVRIGFAASTSRGCNKAQAVEIADIIFDVLSKNISLSEAKDKVASIVKTWHDVMSLQYPLVG